MSQPITVDDTRDPRLGDYVGLTDAQLRRRVEGDRLFIVEGELPIRALLDSPYPVRSLLLTPVVHARLAGPLEHVDAPVYVASRDVMRGIAGFDIHRGAVAAAGRLPMAGVAAVARGARRLGIVEAVNDHENLGALFRNAAVLGMDGVVLSPTCADPLYRRCVRVSIGHVLRMPWTVSGPWPDALRELAGDGWEVVALTPHGDAEPVTVLDGCTGRVAVLVGAEGRGLTDGALAAATRRVRIPMAPGVDSLNVATAAAIAFHRLHSPTPRPAP